MAWAGPANAKRGAAGATIPPRAQHGGLEGLEDYAVMEKRSAKHGQTATVKLGMVMDGTWVTFLVEDAILQFLGS